MKGRLKDELKRKKEITKTKLKERKINDDACN